MIFNIQRYSTHDGSGVRTNIFFKGCPLRCVWCSNPESQSFKPEILFDEKICKKFGDCTQIYGKADSIISANTSRGKKGGKRSHDKEKSAPDEKRKGTSRDEKIEPGHGGGKKIEIREREESGYRVKNAAGARAREDKDYEAKKAANLRESEENSYDETKAAGIRQDEGSSYGVEKADGKSEKKGFGDVKAAGHSIGEGMGRRNSNPVRRRNGKLIIERGLIDDPEAWRDICPSKALIVTGRSYNVNELINEIEKDTPFYERSGGGVTLTGGEPFSHSDYLSHLLPELKKRGHHVSVETSLHVRWEKISVHLKFIDEVLADLKHTDPVKFRDFTGGNPGLVRENFLRLDRSGAKYVVRIPVIPSFNYNWDELTGMIDFALSLENCWSIHLIPFHNLGKEKYKMLGRSYSFENIGPLNDSDLIPLKEYIKAKGITTSIGG